MELEKEPRMGKSEASALPDTLMLLTSGCDVPEWAVQGQEAVSKIWDKWHFSRFIGEHFDIKNVKTHYEVE